MIRSAFSSFFISKSTLFLWKSCKYFSFFSLFQLLLEFWVCIYVISDTYQLVVKFFKSFFNNWVIFPSSDSHSHLLFEYTLDSFECRCLYGRGVLNFSSSDSGELSKVIGLSNNTGNDIWAIKSLVNHFTDIKIVIIWFTIVKNMVESFPSVYVNVTFDDTIELDKFDSSVCCDKLTWRNHIFF